jgi:hypothetical protein
MNSGPVPLSVSGVASSSPEFALGSQVPTVVQPGQTRTIQVTFRPAAAAGYTANLTFQTNDPSHPTVSVPMMGTGAYPSASWSPAALVFGSVEVGAGGQGTLSIMNSGPVPLSVSGVMSSSPEFALGSQVPTVVQPGQTRTIQVTFRPAAAAGYTANLTFQTNDPSHPTVSVPMEGAGVPPSITWTPQSIDFGAVPPNSPETRSLSISNKGAIDLHVTNIKVITSSIPVELAVSVSALVVHPDQTVAIDVTFSPKVVWPWGHQFAGELVFQTDSPAHPNGNVPLSGSVAAWGCLGTPAAVSVTAVKAVATRLRKLRGARRR